MASRDINDGIRDIWDIWKDWDVEREARNIEGWISGYFEETKHKKAIFGSSGGLDSSVIAYLTVNALGAENVVGVLLPEAEASKPTDTTHAHRIVDDLCIESHTIDITPILESYAAAWPSLIEKNDEDEYRYPYAFANVKARTRMGMLYGIAQTRTPKSLVVGTTDKSELLMGYFTKYGDGGTDIEPIKGVYKTQVRIIARELGVPEEIIKKPSSPNLIPGPGHTAESELGVDYETLDTVLYHLVDIGYTRKKIADEFGIDTHIIDHIANKLRYSEHKRRMPPGPGDPIPIGPYIGFKKLNDC